MPIPELSDEFEGDRLDAGKWHDHNPAWAGRQPGFFSPGNVSVSNGQLHLTTRAEELPGLPPGYHGFTTAAVKSRIKVRYGYFEILARPMKSAASSAFFFYENEPAIWTEIDVFEILGAYPGHERALHMSAHIFHGPWHDGPGEHHRAFRETRQPPYALAGEYHRYALEWDEREIKWYFDGLLLRVMPNRYWHQPLYLNFDSETMPDWFGLPDKADLPSTFSIEYVRSWRKQAVAPGRRTLGAPELQR